jgi:hypothetical protein
MAVIAGLLCIMIKEDNNITDLLSSEVGLILIPIVILFKVILTAGASLFNKETRNKNTTETRIVVAGLVIFIAGLIMFKM